MGQDCCNKQKIQEEVEREEQQEYCRFLNFLDIAQWVHCFKAYGKMGTRRGKALYNVYNIRIRKIYILISKQKN